MGFRLQMLRSNLDVHYGDPEFKRSVQELLASTIERLDGIVGRWSAEQDEVLIKVSLDLNPILREVAGSQTRRGGPQPGALESGVPVLSLALGEIPSVWGDPYFLRDAFSSLVDNALEAAGPSGKVLVRSFAAQTGRRAKAVVEIIDNGSGMSSDFVQERLFRPFQTTKSDGVGLGLYTASQIIRHHRGQIQVLSGAGEGTVVRLLFPAAPAQA